MATSATAMRAEHARRGPAAAGPGGEDGADDDHRADGVGDAHQRRVQRRRHVPDDVVADEDGQDEDGEVGDDRIDRDSVHVSSSTGRAVGADERAGDDFVRPVDLQLAGLGVEQQVDEVEQVARVERAGSRRPAWPAGSTAPTIFTPCVIDDLRRPRCSAQLPPCFDRQVDDHRARLHARDASPRCTSTGAGRPGNQRGGDDDVGGLGALGDERGLAPLVVVAHLARVAAGGFLRLASPRPTAPLRRTWRRAIRPAP